MSMLHIYNIYISICFILKNIRVGKYDYYIRFKSEKTEAQSVR